MEGTCWYSLFVWQMYVFTADLIAFINSFFTILSPTLCLNQNSYKNIYTYTCSCLKLLSNRMEAIFTQRSQRSNHEIQLMFEHSFNQKKSALQAVLCIALVQTFVKDFVNVILFSQKMTSLFPMYQNGQSSRISKGIL